MTGLPSPVLGELMSTAHGVEKCSPGVAAVARMGQKAKMLFPINKGMGSL